MGAEAVFSGDSIHTLDPKNRVFVPKRFQEELGRDAEGVQVAVLTRGFEGCLFLFSEEGYAKVLQRLTTQPFGGAQLRTMQRLFFANVHETPLDSSGRVLLPEKLRKYAAIDKEVVMVGDDPRADSGAVLAGVRTLLLPVLPPRTDNGIGSVIDFAGLRR